MCIMCDGASRDEVLFDVHAKVLRHGWALQAVGGEDRRADWIYTVGLSSRYAHPELVIVGGLLDDAASSLNELGELVRGGRRFEAGDLVDLSRGRVSFEEVHPVHLSDGLVAICDEYHEALGGPSMTQRVLQVVPRSGATCAGEPSPPLLSDPTVQVVRGPAVRPNRAARRARTRRHRGGA
jgi:hypothetical protein